MNRTISIQKNLILFGIPLLVIGLMTLLAKSSIFKSNPEMLASGITFDLLLTVPVVFFLLVRKTNIPKTTVVLILILGIIVATTILPSENQYYLNLFKTWVLPVVELTILSFAVYNARKAIQLYKKNREKTFDFFTTLKITCYSIFPKIAVMPIVTEIAVFYYGFIYWKKRDLRQNEFSYHRDSGTIALLSGVIFIVAIETIVIHIILSKWSNLAAWIFTFLSIYTAVQIFGFLRSMLKRPISIEKNKLYLRYGIMNESTIDLREIDSVEISSKSIESNEKTRTLSIFGDLENHNVVIRLNKENTMNGLYGIKRKYKVLALYVDDKVQFKNQMENSL